jgi:hypothetical protein
MAEHKTLKIVSASGQIREVAFCISRGDPCVVETGEYDNRKLRAEASDLFDCLVKIRLDLELEGAKILCNGARLDAFPSPMARDMGGGRKVYLLRMGEPAQLENLVNTFDEAPIEKIASVAEQKKFYLDWLGPPPPT